MLRKLHIQAFGTGHSVDIDNELANKLIPSKNDISVIQPHAIPSILKAAIAWRSLLSETEMSSLDSVDELMQLMHHAKVTNSPVKCVPYEDHSGASTQSLSSML